jgi:hypothetical protein
VQVIDVHGGFKKFVVTLLVMRAFLNSSGASITCADLRDPTAVSRIMCMDCKKTRKKLALLRLMTKLFIHTVVIIHTVMTINTAVAVKTPVVANTAVHI